MSTTSRDFLARLSGETVKEAALQEQQAAAEFDAIVTDELAKLAGAENLDLSQLSDDEIVALKTELAEELLKQAEAEDAGVDDADAAAIRFGQVVAHSFMQELQAAGEDDVGAEKLASLSDEELFLIAAEQRASNVLGLLTGEGVEDFAKEASLAHYGTEGFDPEVDDLLDDAAAEMLAEAGYDLDLIADALENGV